MGMEAIEYEKFRKESIIIKNSDLYFKLGIDEYFHIFLIFMTWIIFNFFLFSFIFSNVVFYYYKIVIMGILILNIPNIFILFVFILWLNLLRKNNSIVSNNFKKNNSIFIYDIEKEFDLWVFEKEGFEKLQLVKQFVYFSEKLEKIEKVLFKTDRNRLRKEILENRFSNIYLLINRVGEIFYVGQALYPKWRFVSHKRKFGKDISMKLIEERIPLDKVNEREEYWISFYGGREHLKNQTKGGSGVLELLIKRELSKAYGKIKHRKIWKDADR